MAGATIPRPPLEAFATYDARAAHVDEDFRAAPLRSAHVKVAEKIPKWAREGIAKSRAATPPAS